MEIHLMQFSVVIAGEVHNPAAAWQKIDWLAINPKPAVVSTRATTSTSTTVSFLRSLLRMQLRNDRLRKMSPERRAIYERIRQLRDEIGPIDFDVVEALWELRENASTPGH